ncbi:thrombopoietin receptor isoform X2 [Hyperolius riggenbachi]|uniref:thrombopoietin receptor isoform X2 n=1 Tax=Hyperolius riggenbachi TaxID=752182 RepID=UPI0035A31D7C
MHINDSNLLFHHIPKVLHWVEFGDWGDCLEMLLLARDQSVPHCFSRTFMEKITCYWEAWELNVTSEIVCGFYYSEGTKTDKEECDVTKQTGNRTLYFCEHHKDPILFNEFHVIIKEKSSKQILHTRTIKVEMFGIIQHPSNITATWEESREQIHVQWVPPPKTEFLFFLQYEVEFWSVDSTERQSKIAQGEELQVLHLTPSQRYHLRVRTRFDEKAIWGPWSKEITFEIPEKAGKAGDRKTSIQNGWEVLVISLSLLGILAVILCLCCKFPTLYRRLKHKLWPPLPNLHRVLDTFLAEIQKQYQPGSTLYEKNSEDVPQPSCLEILSEVTLSNEGQVSTQDYVQLSPSTYQNEDYWPKLELLELHLDLDLKKQPSSGVVNQTYLPTSWSF